MAEIYYMVCLFFLFFPPTRDSWVEQQKESVLPVRQLATLPPPFFCDFSLGDSIEWWGNRALLSWASLFFSSSLTHHLFLHAYYLFLLPYPYRNCRLVTDTLFLCHIHALVASCWEWAALLVAGNREGMVHIPPTKIKKMMTVTWSHQS